MKGRTCNKYLALPFGIGVALVLDESALLLELEDVYWTEEGVLSVQIVVRRDGDAVRARVPDPDAAPHRGQDTETDWEIAAKAWDDLQMIPGGPGDPGIGL